MRVFAFLGMFLALFVTSVDAVPAQRRGQSAAAKANGVSGAAPVTARSAVAARAASVKPKAPQGGAAPVAARAGVKPMGAGGGAVAARAAVKQKVINSGTKITSATENTIVDADCQQKYEGCMDSFCMLENTNGGRCTCSNKIRDLNDILDQIEKLDSQSYSMATTGVERIEMGEDADAAIAKANEVSQSVIDGDKSGDTTKVSRRRPSLDMWKLDASDASDDVFDAFDTSGGGMSPIDGKQGDALRTAAHSLCADRIPECKADISMLQMMYAQKVTSDCNAYENSLKQQKNASAQKLQAAERALRDAALEQLKNSNKYDLGQCAVEFKKCMIKTGGCGEDFADCATVSAMDTVYVGAKKVKSKTYNIKGAVTNIQIASSTYDTLVSKQPLCMNVTKQCVAVRDQVWDTFLREVAPQLKSAELIAEDNVRQNCIGEVSSCFQKACKDTMGLDEGSQSYDLCLADPTNMLNVCKIPMNKCGIDEKKPDESKIWEFVLQRLAAVRVNACTNQVKECLTHQDRCGKDYSNCIGMDNDDIIKMCPRDLLTSCIGEFGGQNDEDFYDNLSNMVAGIMLNIDNSMLTQCQNAAQQAMLKVCGSTEDCNALTLDSELGARTLSYKVCRKNSSTDCVDDVNRVSSNDYNDFQGTIFGEIPWSAINIDASKNNAQMANNSTQRLQGKALSAVKAADVTFDKNIAGSLKIGNTDNDTSKRIEAEMNKITQNVQNVIDTIVADPKVNACIYGRTAPNGKSVGDARVPNLLNVITMNITTQALTGARKNYYAKYDELVAKQAKDSVTLAAKQAEKEQKEEQKARAEAGRIACLQLAKNISLPNDNFTAKNKAKDGDNKTTCNNIDDTKDTNGNYINQSYSASCQISGNSAKVTVATAFNSNNMTCHITKTTQLCEDQKRRFCKKWAEPTVSESEQTF